MLKLLTDYYYEEPAVMDETALVIVVIFYLCFLGIMLAVALATYIFQSISLYKMASRRGIHNPWLAWIPGGNQWIIGSISDQYQYVVKGKVTNRRKILLGLYLGMVVVYVAMMFGSVIAGIASESAASEVAGAGFAMIVLFLSLLLIAVAIPLAVFLYIALYDLFQSADPNNAVLYLVLSIVMGITLPILLFICRNKDGGMPPRKAPPATPVQEPITEETAVAEEGFALPEEFVEEPATEELAAKETAAEETAAEETAEPETTEPTE